MYQYETHFSFTKLGSNMPRGFYFCKNGSWTPCTILSNIKWTQNIIFLTSNDHEHFHLLVLKLKHHISGLKEQTSNLMGPLLDLLNYTSNRLGHHFSNIEWTRTCSCFDNRTRTPYIWVRTSNIVRPSNWIRNVGNTETAI